MEKLNKDFYLRKCYLEKDQVPTQSVMKKKMGPALANAYFKSMKPKLKILAGLEPPLQGGGSDWFMPPKDILKSKAVLKHLKKEQLTKLGYKGIEYFGKTLVKNFHKDLLLEKERLLLENDNKWMKTLEVSCKHQREETSLEQSKLNTYNIQQAFQEFTTMYKTSIIKLEQLLTDAGMVEVERVKEETFNKMTNNYETLLKQQATMLYDRYKEKTTTMRNKLKDKFVEDVKKCQIELQNDLHDINLEKHTAVEKLRTLLECQNLACQIYVALKERSEFNKEIDISKQKHEKTIKRISEQIEAKSYEIRLKLEKEKKRQEFNHIWQRKVCHVVKRFQEFVKYCLSTLPDSADFFIDMEKLMLLQLGDALENPSAESIFEPEEEKQFPTPVPKPHPFYLICDKGFKPQVDQNLCPKHCTSSASQLPVIVVNKRCVYAACNNLETFQDKVNNFLDSQRSNDEDFVDDHDYTYDVPIKCTSSDQLLQLNLESSLMQILQNEIPNVKNVPVECCVCKIPYCFCSPLHTSEMYVKLMDVPLDVLDDTVASPVCLASGEKITRSKELVHVREPKINSYLEYTRPKACKCPKVVKKDLQDHLPKYMQNMSTYEKVDLPHYETCDIDKIKTLIRKSRGIRPKKVEGIVTEPKTKNASTQYSDQEFDSLCRCFSDEELHEFFKELISGLNLKEIFRNKFKVVDGSVSTSHLEKRPSSFAVETAVSLKDMIVESPELKEIFKKDDCNY